LNKKIILSNINFDYDNKKILTNCNLSIDTNSVTLISGKSGSGKSTLVDLITGLQKPSSGEIYFDSINLQELDLRNLRKKISVVNQDPFLFYDTIRNNVAWAEEEISDEKINEALQLANALEFVEKFPNKINTLVGERGMELSGGERQRIVLARALIRKPSILILDEATNSLDEHSENMIKDTIKKISQNTTVIIIAHMSKLKEISDKKYLLVDQKIYEENN
jgi:subfamily B ATP-binding cassette protein MsbA